MSGGTKRPHKCGTGKRQGLQRTRFEGFGFRHGVEPPKSMGKSQVCGTFQSAPGFSITFLKCSLSSLLAARLSSFFLIQP